MSIAPINLSRVDKGVPETSAEGEVLPSVYALILINKPVRHLARSSASWP